MQLHEIVQRQSRRTRDATKTVTPGRARLEGYRPAGARIYEYVAHDGDGVTAGREKCNADSCTEAWLQRSEAAAAKCGDCSGARNRTFQCDNCLMLASPDHSRVRMGWPRQTTSAAGGLAFRSGCGGPFHLYLGTLCGARARGVGQPAGAALPQWLVHSEQNFT